MKIVAVLLSLLGVSMSLMAKELTVERIYSDPSLTGPAPRAIKLAPDGSRVTYLKNKADDQERYDLWEYHIRDGKSRMLVDSLLLGPADEQLSDEEKARRERQRLFATGIVDYFWSSDSRALVFPLGGDIYHYDLGKKPGEAVSQLTHTDAYETDVKLSPDGKFVAFIRKQNLYVVEIASGKEKQLTTDGKGTVKNGMAEFVAQEEMDRDTGYWWSPDSRKIAFARIDESDVEVEKRYEINADSFTVFEQRYPRTGTANVAIRIGVLELAGGETHWMDLGEEQDIYVARVKWLPDSQRLAIQRQSRDQKTLDLLFADSSSGKSRVLLTETARSWVNLNDDLTFLKSRPCFVWGSERSGFKHLYLYDLDGKLVRPLTRGDWVVEKVLGVDEARGRIYFSANASSPLEQHLYAVPLAGNAAQQPEQISDRTGVHEITLADSKNVYVDNFSAPEVPPQVSLHRISGERLTFLEENRLDKSHPWWPYSQSEPKAEFGHIDAEDGQQLYYRLYKPEPFEAGKKYPVIIDVYGGPGAQRVQKTWTARNGYWHKLMAARGFVVFSLDNRGATNRGTAFEAPIHRHLGVAEVADQVRGVEFLKTLPYVDGDRVGIFGWSYGGYMTLMTMMKQPEIFHAGVSVAPVTDWRLYDTHYTERYLGHPEENRAGYDKSNVFPWVKGLQGPLLIVHGMADDNVLFTNSTKLYKVLQDKHIPFEMMNYPGSKHSIHGKDVRIHLFETITRFFEENLGKADKGK